MIFSNEISLTNLLFCIDYFHIPVLVDQMLDHFSRYDDILNYKLCLSIIDVFGIDSYIAQTAYLRLTHSNSFPQVWRRLPITEFVGMNDKALDFLDLSMSLHFEHLPSGHLFTCHICWNKLWGTYHLNDCCQSGCHASCGDSYIFKETTQTCKFCQKTETRPIPRPASPPREPQNWEDELLFWTCN